MIPCLDSYESLGDRNFFYGTSVVYVVVVMGRKTVVMGSNPTLPPASCGTWGPYFNPSGHPFPYHCNGGNHLIGQT